MTIASSSWPTFTTSIIGGCAASSPVHPTGFRKAFGFRAPKASEGSIGWYGLTVAFMPSTLIGSWENDPSMQHRCQPLGPWRLIGPAATGHSCGGINPADRTTPRQHSAGARKLSDETGDPWTGVRSQGDPFPPSSLIAVLPRIDGERGYWQQKQRARRQQGPLGEAPDLRTRDAEE